MGLKVTTSLDIDVQSKAEEIVKDEVSKDILLCGDCACCVICSRDLAHLSGPQYVGGYYATTAAGRYMPVAPARLMDSRQGLTLC